MTPSPPMKITETIVISDSDDAEASPRPVSPQKRPRPASFSSGSDVSQDISTSHGNVKDEPAADTVPAAARIYVKDEVATSDGRRARQERDNERNSKLLPTNGPMTATIARQILATVSPAPAALLLDKATGEPLPSIWPGSFHTVDVGALFKMKARLGEKKATREEVFAAFFPGHPWPRKPWYTLLSR